MQATVVHGWTPQTIAGRGVRTEHFNPSDEPELYPAVGDRTPRCPELTG